jgi:hypothetical protein
VAEEFRAASELSAAPIETEISQLSIPIDSRTMTDLPLLTRNACKLVLLPPGVIQTNDFSAGFSVIASLPRAISRTGILCYSWQHK